MAVSMLRNLQRQIEYDTVSGMAKTALVAPVRVRVRVNEERHLSRDPSGKGLRRLYSTVTVSIVNLE